MTISPRSAQRVRQAIRLWLVYRTKPMQVEDPGLPPKRSKKEGQQERKVQHKQRVLEEHGEEPPPGVQRVWTDGSQQKGVDGSQYAGYGVWFGERRCQVYSRPITGQNCKHVYMH